MIAGYYIYLEEQFYSVTDEARLGPAFWNPDTRGWGQGPGISVLMLIFLPSRPGNAASGEEQSPLLPRFLSWWPQDCFGIVG